MDDRQYNRSPYLSSCRRPHFERDFHEISTKNPMCVEIHQHRFCKHHVSDISGSSNPLRLSKKGHRVCTRPGVSSSHAVVFFSTRPVSTSFSTSASLRQLLPPLDSSSFTPSKWLCPLRYHPPLMRRCRHRRRSSCYMMMTCSNRCPDT
jgi:hypothetical protein